MVADYTLIVENIVEVENDIVREFKKKSSIGISKATELSGKYVRTIAPKDTWSLVKAIKTKTRKEKDGLTGYVISNTPRNPKHKFKPVPYNIYMFYDNKRHYRGDRRYMETLYRFISKRLKGIVEANLYFE